MNKQTEALKMVIELLEDDLLDIAIEMKNEVVSKSWSDLRTIEYYDQIVEYTKQAIQDCKEALEPQTNPEFDVVYHNVKQPAQSWQGLNDDEIEVIINKVRDDYYPWKDGMLFGRVARAIEQALKEKNGN